jgi:hypothetical protein
MRLQVLLIPFVMLAFNGCTEKVYVDRVVKKNVIIPCHIPDVYCATKEELRDMNDSEIVGEAFRCIQEYKTKVEVCR